MADVGIGTPIGPAAGIEHRIHPGTAVAPAQAQSENPSGGGAQPPAPAPTLLGTIIEAIVRAPAAAGATGPPVGAHLWLRFVAPGSATPDLVNGTVVESAAGETMVATAIGLLALQRRLSLAVGTALAFEVIEIVARPRVPDPLASRGGWRALEEALLALSATPFGEQLRGELASQSGAQLAGTLLFLIAALYHGNWPGPVISSALAAAKQAALVKRLSDDIAALRSLSSDPATGDWRVLTLPLLLRNTVLPLRLFLSRRTAPAEDGIRFAIEAGTSRFGPVQLDGLLRGTRLILVLRSRQALALELRAALKAAFADTLAKAGLIGDLSFVTAAQFLIDPFVGFRNHVNITA